MVTLQTSGTTGEPKRIYFTRMTRSLPSIFSGVACDLYPGRGSGDDLTAIRATRQRGRFAGDRIGKVECSTGTLWPGARPGPCSSSDGDGEDQRDGGSTRECAYLGTLLGSSGIRGLPGKPKQVLLSTDHVPQAIVAALESIWGCTVNNHYGMTEMGLGGGVECQARRGYHLREADLYFEIVHPQTGQPVPARNRRDRFHHAHPAGHAANSLSYWRPEPLYTRSMPMRNNPAYPGKRRRAG